MTMWDWLTSQAQTASPFIATFCLLLLTGSARVIQQLYRANEKKQEVIIAITQASVQANSAVALAIEWSSSTIAIAIEGLKAQIQNGNSRGRR